MSAELQLLLSDIIDGAVIDFGVNLSFTNGLSDKDVACEDFFSFSPSFCLTSVKKLTGDTN